MYPCYVNTCAAATGPTADWTGVVPSNGDSPVEVAITLPVASVNEVHRYDTVRPAEVAGAICGQVVDPAGTPVRDFRILLQWPHTYHQAGLHPSISIDYWTKGASFTSEDGSFVLGLSRMPAGQIVRVVAVAEGYSQEALDVVTVGAVNAIGPADALVLHLGPPRSLSVRVVEAGAGRRPILDAQVTVMDTHPRLGDEFRWNATPSRRPVTLSTDSQGWARFSGLVLTEGTVVAQKAGYARGHVEWRAGENELSVSMGPECVVKGQVFDDEGIPLESGYVLLTRLSNRTDIDANTEDEQYDGLIRPGDQGRFHIDQLPPGTYKLRAHWWESEPVPVDIGYTDEFTLEPGDMISLTYPEDSNMDNPGRWIAETSGDPADETIRSKLIGTWRGDVRFANGSVAHLVYCFREDGSAELMTFSDGRPQDRDPRGYFKVHQGSLKILQDCGVGTFSSVTFTDPDTLVLGTSDSSNLTLKRDRTTDEVVGATNSLAAPSY
jgi:hypothetical protein